MKGHRDVLAAVVLAVTCCGATGAPAPVSGTDRAWLDTAHQTNLAEVEAGELAHKKGTSAAVRAAGAMLVTDHTRFDTSVVRVARSLRVDLNEAAPPEDAAATDRFANESGSAFDYDFVFTMLTGHQKMIADTQDEIRRGSSPQVTGLARTALPILQRHRATLRKAAAAG
jgi:putative membrane protein